MIVYVPEDIMDRLEKQLQKTPDMIPDVLRKTINSVAKYGRKATVERTREKYVLKKATKRIRDASEYESARGKQFNATILIKGHPEPLISFEVRKNGKRVSAKAKVLQTSKLEKLTTVKDGETLKAFVQTVKAKSKQGDITHHVGVFRRMTEEEREESNSEKRNAIKQLYSTSIPQMVKNDEVYPQIEKDIKAELHRTLEKHIAKVMEGMK